MLDDFYKKRDFRWIDPDTRRILSWKETLEAMCRYYGTFNGRWHTNEFWNKTLQEISNMTEDECEKKVREIELRADCRLNEWRIIND